MKNFAMAQEQFRKMKCAHCQATFSPEGVKLLREEKDYWVVRVHCLSCNQPAGVAIVGVEYEGAQPLVKGNRKNDAPEERPIDRVGAVFNTKKEAEKFDTLAPIGTNEVLDAHSFFRELGSDWMKHLPKR